MTTSIQDTNTNKIMWSPMVLAGSLIFTPNQPLKWKHELAVTLETVGEWNAPGESRDLLSEIRTATPPNSELRQMARENPPPDTWFEGDEDRPF